LLANDFINLPHVKLFIPFLWDFALLIAMLAADSTIHSKFSSPTELTSASGAGLQKSIA